jgi:hypothetical protein
MDMTKLKSLGTKVGLISLCFMLILPAAAAAAVDDTTPIDWMVKPTSAPELRAQLGGLFGEYALLNAAFGMSVIDENNETAQDEFSSLNAVQANIDDLSATLEHVVGTEQAVLFQLELEQYADSYFNYVLAVKEYNVEDQDIYRNMLMTDENDRDFRSLMTGN